MRRGYKLEVDSMRTNLLHRLQLKLQRPLSMLKVWPRYCDTTSCKVWQSQGPTSTVCHADTVVGSKLKSADLRIHEDTERGDNDTINNPYVPGGKVKIGGA